jgi:hypothetical protein
MVSTITAASGRELGQLFTFTLVEPISPEQFTMIEPACGTSGVNFANDIILFGYRVGRQVRRDEAVDLTLYWSVRRSALTNYQIFVHLLRMVDTPPVIGQQDANGAYSQSWRPGDLIINRYQITADALAPAGEYLLQIGLYDLADRRYPRAQIVGDAASCADINSGHNAFIIRGISFL